MSISSSFGSKSIGEKSFFVILQERLSILASLLMGNDEGLIDQ